MKEVVVPRLVRKDGVCLVRHGRPPQKRWKEFKNLFTTLLDYKWRYIILTVALGFIISWSLFGFVYYLISYLHGDLTDYAREHGEDWHPCIQNLDGMLAALFFSMESQHTIGYGYRFITTACPETSIFLSLQCIVGSVLQAIITGLVLAKLLRPKKRRQEVIFSQNAVITRQDGDLCFKFRIADVGEMHLVETHLRLYLVKRYVTQEGTIREIQPMKFFDMNVGFDNGWDRILLMWPMTVSHVINEQSPLFGITAQKLEKHVKRADFEIIACLEGIVESTGMTTQARTSFLPGEILWEHRFCQIVFRNKKGFQEISYEQFDKTCSLDSKIFTTTTSAECEDNIDSNSNITTETITMNNYDKL